MSVRKTVNSHSGRMFSDRRWKVPFFVSLLVSIIPFTAALFGLFLSPYGRDQLHLDIMSVEDFEISDKYFVEPDLRNVFESTEDAKEIDLPRLAYLISGMKGDSQRMTRTLQAVYYPRNQYVLHMDLKALPQERLNLAMSVKNDRAFSEVENVHVMAQSNLVTYKGPAMIACTV